MAPYVVIYAFEGVTQGLVADDAEILRDWLVKARNVAADELGRRLAKALEAGAPLSELTLADVPALRTVLDGADLNSPGLAALAQSVGAEPPSDSV